MPFDDADAYDRFMGRWSERLAPTFLDYADLGSATANPPRQVLDLGCGPGILTAELARWIGPDRVVALDPSPAFVEATAARLPGVDARRATAEDLPLEDDSVEAALAQLVVHFMADPDRGLAEMARVTRPGGVVAACVWDHAGGRGPLSAYWRAARVLRPDEPAEDHSAGSAEGDLVRRFEAAGLDAVTGGDLAVTLGFAGFEDWWTPFTLGVGTAGDHLAALAPGDRERLEAECRAELGDGPFELTVHAWAARGVA